MVTMAWHDLVTLDPAQDHGSDAERLFMKALIVYGKGIPEPQREYRFHATRQWRIDAAWPDVRVGVEINGGAYSGGRHTRGSGFTEDCRKYSMAAAQGWRLLHFTPEMLKDDPDTCIGVLRAALRWNPMEIVL